MTTFADRLREARRLAILQLLAQAPDYEAGQDLLYMALPDQGLAASADQVAGELAWLAEQGLVILTEIGTVKLARVSARGLDVARGLTRVPGVARPRPGG